MILPLTVWDALARGIHVEGHTAFATDGTAVGDYDAESRLVRLDVPDCSPRPVAAGGYPAALGGLPTSPPAMALLTMQVDEWVRN